MIFTARKKLKAKQKFDASYFCFSSTSVGKGLSAFVTTGGMVASESEVEDEESTPVIESSSPTADAGKSATTPLTTTTTTAATAPATTATDGEKEGRNSKK